MNIALIGTGGEIERKREREKMGEKMKALLEGEA